MRRNQIILGSFFLIILLSLFVIFLKNAARSPYPIYNVAIEVATDDENVTVVARSAHGSEVLLEKVGPGKYRTINPRVLQSIEVISSSTEPIAVKIGRTSDQMRQLSEFTTDKQKHVFTAPESGSHLFGPFKGCLNYIGDVRLLSICAINSVFVLVILFGAWRFRKLPLETLRSLREIGPNRYECMLGLPFLVITLWVSSMHVGSEFLRYRHPDEIVIAEGIYRYPGIAFSNFYGSLFSITQQIFGLPGSLLGDRPLFYVGQRAIGALSAYAVLTLLVAAFRRPGERLNLHQLLVAFFFMSMPAFWSEASIGRPDWPMALLVILSTLVVIRKNHDKEASLLQGTFLFSAALAIKLQALTFLPILLTAAVFTCIEKRAINWRLAGRMLLVLSVGFFCLNSKWLVFTDSILTLERLATAISNESGFGSDLVPASLETKLWVVSSRFCEWFVFLSIALVVAFLTLIRRSNFKTTLPILTGVTVCGIFYFAFAAESRWNYYVQLFAVTLFLLPIIPHTLQLRKFSFPARTLMLSFCLVGSLLFARTSGRLENLGYCMNDFYVASEGDIERQTETWSRIRVLLHEDERDNIRILLSPCLMFDDDDREISEIAVATTMWPEDSNETSNPGFYCQYSLRDYQYIAIKKVGKSSFNPEKLERIRSASLEAGKEAVYENDFVAIFR